ncbi:protein translocase subunit SecE [mine drainage metagenome]|jgi:preprotein translocase subunit SecE|uniref:Protein translocase subunit SecE n=1 Tax=mine drainage metagenome TaxID=410659 RepID=A0A1J5PYC6_9ZZZZ|nr:preprotein translocase subunit SecE [Paracoccaceae bacterium]
MAQVNPLKFVQQVRSEVGKVHWPSRREVLLTTIMVFAMSVVTATFFSLIDISIQSGLNAVLHMFQ